MSVSSNWYFGVMFSYNNVLCISLLSLCASCPKHLISVDLTIIICSKEHQSWRPTSLFPFSCHSPPQGRKFYSTPSPCTFHIYSTPRETKFTQPYKTISKTIVLYILQPSHFDSRWGRQYILDQMVISNLQTQFGLHFFINAFLIC